MGGGGNRNSGSEMKDGQKRRSGSDSWEKASNLVGNVAAIPHIPTQDDESNLTNSFITVQHWNLSGPPHCPDSN